MIILCSGYLVLSARSSQRLSSFHGLVAKLDPSGPWCCAFIWYRITSVCNFFGSKHVTCSFLSTVDALHSPSTWYSNKPVQLFRFCYSALMPLCYSNSPMHFCFGTSFVRPTQYYFINALSFFSVIPPAIFHTSVISSFVTLMHVIDFLPLSARDFSRRSEMLGVCVLYRQTLVLLVTLGPNFLHGFI